MVEGHVPARACWFDSSPGQLMIPKMQNAKRPSRSLRFRRLRFAFFAMCSAIFIPGIAFCISGCRQASPGRSIKTQSDTLREHYADLATGRFAVIADFEDTSHEELFKLEGADTDPGDLFMDPVGGMSGTGGGCLRVVFHGTDDRLVADNSTARKWTLKRDWRPYQLLLMNVYCPRSDLQLEVVLVSGDGDFTSEAHSRIPLHRGWNLLRLDLDEASDFIALDDIRRIRWLLPTIEEPVELKIDDVLLTNNRTELFGTAEGDEGSMYVVREGRRIHVGSAGRFELAFSGGQIVRWYALASDPLRLRDWVGAGNALGPMPVIVQNGEVLTMPGFGQAAQTEPGNPKPGKLIVARQRVLEANNVRVIVECEWAFEEPASETLEDESAQWDKPAQPTKPARRWTYAIYSSGDVFVSWECATGDGTFGQGEPGFVITRLAMDGMQAGTHEPNPSQSRPTSRRPTSPRPMLQDLCYGWLIPPDGRAGLLYVAHDSRKCPRMKVVRNATRRSAWNGKRAGDSDSAPSSISLVGLGSQADPPVSRWHGLLSLWPEGNGAVPSREDRALAYAYLPKLEFLVGGFDRVYEINRNFRNEGVSTQHNPEFTMLELYRAYASYEDLIDMVEALLHGMSEAILG